MNEIQHFQGENGKFYLAYSPRPDYAISRSDGKFYRVESKTLPDGSVSNTDIPLCEDCWRDIPRYVDFPRGLVSAESDGDRGGNFSKHRKAAVEGKDGTEAVQKIVCLECYLASFKRMNPGVRPPALKSEIYGIIDTFRIEQPTTEYHSVPEPRA